MNLNVGSMIFRQRTMNGTSLAWLVPEKLVVHFIVNEISFRYDSFSSILNWSNKKEIERKIFFSLSNVAQCNL